MTYDELFRMTLEHFKSLFPKECGKCGRRYETLRDYILATERVDGTIFYDADAGDWLTENPIGAVALANCACGSTLAVTTKGLELPKIHALLEYVKVESEGRGVTPSHIMGEVRDAVRKHVLAEPATAKSED